MINDVICEISTPTSSKFMLFLNVMPCDLVDALLMPLIASVSLVFFLPYICATFPGRVAK